MRNGQPLCMMAYYIDGHMRHALRPLLEETDGFTNRQAILQQLGTIKHQSMDVRGHPFRLVTTPDPQQRGIFELLAIPAPA